MSNEFKEGDIVRCVSRRYRYTSYKRPCIVKRYDYSGKLLVEPFDDGGSVYDVDGTCFEIVPSGEILKNGQVIFVKGIAFEEKIEFVKYLPKGNIRVEINGWHEDIDIDRVTYTRRFYV